MRKKILFKKILKLKRNVQNSKKVLKFKKKKWKKFIFLFKKTVKVQNGIFGVYKIFDHNKYVLKRFMYQFKKNYSYKLLVKNRLNTFYGNLKKKYIKKKLSENKHINNLNYNFSILKTFESRLDIVLYRAYFTKSVKSARQMINNNQVYVNKRLTNKNSFILKNGDLIEISKKSHNIILNSIKTTEFWPLPPKHLQINFRCLQIIFIGNFKNSSFYFSYPFWLDLNSWLKNYKHK